MGEIRAQFERDGTPIDDIVIAAVAVKLLGRSRPSWYSERVEHQETILAMPREALPSVQAVYLFGSCADNSARRRDQYRQAGESCDYNYTRQGAAMLNITRACE